MNPDWPSEPSSFDPAIHLHSDLVDAVIAPSFSDDIEAFHTLIEETAAENNRNRVVIRHRSWKTEEIFRSEDDCSIASPSRTQLSKPLENQEGPTRLETAGTPIASSPPVNTFSMSSPITFPTLSSPTTTDSPRKKRKVDEPRSPLKKVDGNTRIAGFVYADSDDENDVPGELFHKPKSLVRPALVNPSVTTSNVEPQTDDRENVPESTYSQNMQEAQPHSSDRGPLELLTVKTFSGKSMYVGERRSGKNASYEQVIAARSVTQEGQAKKSYYGVDMHNLLDEISKQKTETAARQTVHDAIEPVESIEKSFHSGGKKSKSSMLWTEKYRARKFTDLIGDERTHRSVLRWLKAWDSIVFPGSSKPKPKAIRNGMDAESQDHQAHRKILLLTGPPGLGKTTLAHVCAKQAGYEVQEINASDERSRDVVRGRIRDMVGTENVRGLSSNTADGKVRKAGKPVCVVVDEVDGVVSGSGGGGEGGFIKALLDLVLLDQRNTKVIYSGDTTSTAPQKKKKGDRFRFLRPLILICNDLYHPSLRPLRQSSLVEVVLVRKPSLHMVVSRMHSIFEREGLVCDSDGVRRLCEATWGVSTRKDGGFGSGSVEGDIRSVMVVGEWVASRFRSSAYAGKNEPAKLTKRWIEDNILQDLTYGGGAARSLGRGGAREVVDRVFQEGAGFPRTAVTSSSNPVPGADVESTGVVGVAEAVKRRAIGRLRDMIDSSGDIERIVTDCFSSYPNQPIQDDNFLTKPNLAYAWLHFHDALSSQLNSSQEWELAPYLSTPIIAFHNLFAASAMARHAYAPATATTKDFGAGAKDDNNDPAAATPFSGPSASFAASEALKASTAELFNLQSSLSLPLARMYRSRQAIATELLPYVLRLLAPDIKPVIVNTSIGGGGASGSGSGPRTAPTASVRKAEEKDRVMRATDCMAATGVRFERNRVEGEAGRSSSGGWVYRMEPGLDSLATFGTFSGKASEGVRFAVRQVLEGEWRRRAAWRNAGDGGLGSASKAKDQDDDGEHKLGIKAKLAKKDFFGRVIVESSDSLTSSGSKTDPNGSGEGRVWVSYHEGFSNAVRKPLTLEEFMKGL